MDIFEKTLKKNTVFKGRIINLRSDIALLPDGSEAGREVVEHPGGVCVLPLCDDGTVLMVEQFRYPYKQALLEIPAGKKNSKGEDTLSCGKRELEEETGAYSNDFLLLGELYPSPGYCDEVITMYAATKLKFGDAHPDSDEFLNLKRIPFDALVDMVLKGDIKDAKTQAAVLKVKILRDKGEL